MPLNRAEEYLLSYDSDRRSWTLTAIRRDGDLLRRIAPHPVAVGEPAWIAALTVPTIHDEESQS